MKTVSSELWLLTTVFPLDTCLLLALQLALMLAYSTIVYTLIRKYWDSKGKGSREVTAGRGFTSPRTPQQLRTENYFHRASTRYKKIDLRLINNRQIVRSTSSCETRSIIIFSNLLGAGRCLATHICWLSTDYWSSFTEKYQVGGDDGSSVLVLYPHFPPGLSLQPPRVSLRKKQHCHSSSWQQRRLQMDCVVFPPQVNTNEWMVSN